MTLTEFLLARIAEDETAARDRDQDAPIHTVGCFYYDNDISPMQWRASHCDCEPEVKARALAECEAKRRIVGLHGGDYDGECLSPAHLDGPCRTLQSLALPYADHPDFRDEWRP